MSFRSQAHKLIQASKNQEEARVEAEPHEGNWGGECFE